MSFLNPPEPALQSLDEEGRVIYVGFVFQIPVFRPAALDTWLARKPSSAKRERCARSIRQASARHLQRTVANFSVLWPF